MRLSERQRDWLSERVPEAGVRQGGQPAMDKRQGASHFGTDLDSDGRNDLVILTNEAPAPRPGPGGGGGSGGDPDSGTGPAVGGRFDRGPAPVVRAVRSASACRADFNRSGAATVQDLFDFLAAWFAGCTGSGPSPCQFGTADFNGVGGVTVQDVFDFVTVWFGGCE